MAVAKTLCPGGADAGSLKLTNKSQGKTCPSRFPYRHYDKLLLTPLDFFLWNVKIIHFRAAIVDARNEWTRPPPSIRATTRLETRAEKVLPAY